MDLLDKVKAILRISTDDQGITEEIKALIAAAKAYVLSTGIDLETEPLFELAVMTYCKGNFGFDNPEAPRFLESYESIKQKMMNAKEYRNAQQYVNKSDHI